MKLHLRSKGYAGTPGKVEVSIGNNGKTKKILRQVWIDIISTQSDDSWVDKEACITLNKDEAIDLARRLLDMAVHAD